MVLAHQIISFALKAERRFGRVALTRVSNSESLESPAPQLRLSHAPEFVFYFECSGCSPRRIVSCFEPASEPGGVELVMILKRPRCVTVCPCSRALTTLLGMDATAPVAPDVPWASAKCVEASKEAMTSAERFKGKLGVKWFWLICVILHAYGIMPQSNILFRTGAAILLMKETPQVLRRCGAR